MSRYIELTETELFTLRKIVWLLLSGNNVSLTIVEQAELMNVQIELEELKEK